MHVLWSRAQQNFEQKNFAGSESALIELLLLEENNRPALELLSVVYLTTGRTDDCIDVLQKLCSFYPSVAAYCERLADLLERRGDISDAIKSYQRLLECNEDLANCHYNLARLLNRAGDPEHALKQYQSALNLGIAQAEDVYSNMSVILSDRHRHDEAQAALNTALEINPNYVPALFNLGVVLEELGEWNKASDLFKRILELEPEHLDALTHLAHGKPVSNSNDPLIAQLETALNSVSSNSEPNNDSKKEALHFALGKALDDSKQYDTAFKHFSQGNAFSVQRSGAYDRRANEDLNSAIMAFQDAEWLNGIEPVSDSSPIFICGMFRSGSTLLEQMLAAHPKVSAGGEINFFNKELALPQALDGLSDVRLREVGKAYLRYLKELFPDAERITNKRPDNFVYLGLIRAIYPNARFINTLRYPLDNCLSIYFQQFAGSVKYHSQLLDIGHYYAQYRHLMTFWKQHFSSNVFDVDYQQLVSEPKSVLEPLLEFLNLDWHDACLEFHKADNRVRTASVWQVRQPLYQRSKGRWNHYAQHLGPLEEYLLAAGIEL
ncbi:MAG: sulfotransferase [Pseudomonadales bacterium]